MRRRTLTLTEAAQQDLFKAWAIVAERDGEGRAEQLKNRILSFVRSLEDFAELGSRHEDRVLGLRSSGIPGLRSVTILFQVTVDTVTVIAIGYLGRNVWGWIKEPPRR